MQPDLPDPVVPAIRRCGMRARSVQTAFPEMSLPSQTDSGLALAGQVAEDVAERDELRREVRNLDADGLLAGDRREDPDLRRRERVGEVVLEPGDLRHLRPGRELELVARHARARDLPDHGRVDAELGQRADEEVGGLRARVADFAGSPRATARSSVRSGSRYSACSDDVSKTDSTLSNVRLGLVGDEERASPPSAPRTDDVGIGLRSVEQAVLRSRRRRRGPFAGRRASSAVCDSLEGHSNARRAPVPARFTAWPVRRRIAPVEAPLTSRSPASSSAPPMIAAPGLADERGERAAERHAR